MISIRSIIHRKCYHNRQATCLENSILCKGLRTHACIQQQKIPAIKSFGIVRKKKTCGSDSTPLSLTHSIGEDIQLNSI